MTLFHADGRCEDANVRILDDDAAPTGATWEAIRLSHQSTDSATADFGLFLDNTADVEALPTPLSFAFIALDVPTFTDGRAYSQARVLRERAAFKGPIVAIGDVLPDQASYLLRCGIDVFQVPNAEAGQALERKLRDFSVAYQHTVRGCAVAHPYHRGR